MTNLIDLIELFKKALENRDDIIIDPYDYAIITKVLSPEDAISLYNEVTVLTEEEVEELEVEIEDYEVLINFNEKLFKLIISTLERFL